MSSPRLIQVLCVIVGVRVICPWGCVKVALLQGGFSTGARQTLIVIHVRVVKSGAQIASLVYRNDEVGLVLGVDPYVERVFLQVLGHVSGLDINERIVGSHLCPVVGLGWTNSIFGLEQGRALSGAKVKLEKLRAHYRTTSAVNDHAVNSLRDGTLWSVPVE